MKNLQLIISLALLSTLTSFSPEGLVKELDLLEAIEAKLITVDAVSNGKYSGYSVILNLKNNTNQNLKIHVPAGLKYNPEDNGEQTLIQLNEQFVALKPNASYDGKIAAFCTEASDRCPSENSGMKITKNNDSKMNELIAYLKGKNITKSTYQDAVWAISDNHAVSNIVADTPQDIAFRKKIAEITGQKNNWYTSPQNVQVDEYGNFTQETVKISGMVEFTCPKGTEVRQDIMTSDGEVFFSSDRTMRAAYGNVTYKFNLAVRGWDKGDYYLRIHDGNSEFARYDFSI